MDNLPTTEKALAVLRETVHKRPDASGLMASPTGVRLVQMMKSFGFAGKRPLSTAEIIQISAVLICLDVLSQDIAKATFRMYERLPGGGKREVEAQEHPVAALLKSQPNRFHTWYEFFEMLMLHMALIQNAFIAKRIDRKGMLTELVPCMPARTTILSVLPEQDSAGMGFFAYEVHRFSPQEKIMFGGMPDVFLPHEFIHLRGRMFDGLAGYSNLDAGAKAFGLADELNDYQTRLFANDGQLRGIFQRPGDSGDTLSEPAYKRLRDQLAEAMGTLRREGRPIVLEEGMAFQQIAQTAAEAEISKGRDAAVIDMARIFRIPPHKMMQLQNVKYENMETLEKSYVQDTLIPYCKRIEPRMAASLLSREEQAKYFLEFDRKEMMFNDPAKILEQTKVLGQMGALTLDEVREANGRNPMKNNAGDVRLIPSTYNLIDADNEIILAAGGAAAEEEEAGDGTETAADDKKTADDNTDADNKGYLDNVTPLRAV